ncbi:beta-lactamase/transpeptidase-like protein [Thozetella sp. PMI_491]|nr:beta-lactamase/transpeptidase-like protein [Thozetella sp. PMI_491]
MKRQLTCVLALGSAVAASGHGRRPGAETESQAPLGVGSSNPLNDDFAKFVHELLEHWHVPSAAVGIVDGDHTWTKANVASNTPATEHTLYSVGSTTKAFTGAAVAHIIDSGSYKNPTFPQRVVDWKTPVADILPDDFVLQDEWATTHLTFEDTLTHRSGMPRHDETYGGYNATLRDAVRSMRYMPLSEPPRTKYQYCNLMFMVASHAIETLTSRYLGDVLKDWIWKPLGMTETYFSVKAARDAGAHVATGYYWHPDEHQFKEAPWLPIELVSGAGTILSSVTDYTKWLRSLIYEAGPLSKGVHKDIKAPRVFDSVELGFNDAPSGYSLGWSTTTYKGHSVWKHGGAIDTMGAEVIFVPDIEFAVVVFANTGLTANLIGTLIVYKLLHDKIGLPEEERPDWASYWQKTIDQMYGKFETAKDTLYPDRPETPIAPALPLEAYAGTYYHPAYRNTTIYVGGPKPARIADSKLGVDRADAVWRMTGELQHISGEYWILYSYFTTVPVSPISSSPVQFHIGADGKVASLDIEFGDAPRGKGDGSYTWEKIA